MQIKHDPPAASRLSELMQQIADEAASAEVAMSRTVRENGLVWHVMGDIGNERHKALEYLALRGLIEYSADGKLVRFVEGQS